MDISLSDIGWVGGGLLLLMALSLLFTRRSDIAQAFDRFLMSRGGTPMLASGPQTGSVMVVRGDTDQDEPEPIRDFDAVLDFLKRHNLTDDQLIAVYAISHRAPDDYPMSANKIRDAVGGTRDDVLAAVATYRPKPAQARSQGRLLRPEGGW